jgi:GNAT superfamily N-acetyltransferase
LARRPDLLDRSIPRRDAWPEYNLHGDIVSLRWGRLPDDLPDLQLFALSDDDEVLGEGTAAPCWWDSNPAHLPNGIDAAVVDALEGFDEGRPSNTLCVLAVIVAPRARRSGVSRLILQAMADLARHQGLAQMIAPVRPLFKERYPLTPIERFMTWRRPDGWLFDPWMRTHERLGAVVGPPLPHSLRITGTLAEWEQWTGLVFPDPGRYVIPNGLDVLVIDRSRDVGWYWEPNVWMIHPL